MCREKLLATMDAIGRGEPAPDGVMVHVSRETTQADWDALDPNSCETTCRDCGAYYEGRLGEDLVCPECGSRSHGAVGSPAGGMHLLMHDPSFW